MAEESTSGRGTGDELRLAAAPGDRELADAGPGADVDAVPPADADDAPGVDAVAMASATSDVAVGSFGDYLRSWAGRVRHGESGMLPVLVGRVIIVILFQVKSSVFLSPGNLANLIMQGSALIVLGMAEVFVLLLGEIERSIGYVAAVAAVVTVALSSSDFGPDWPWWLAIIVGLAVASVIGALQGLLITLLGLPSFVVTLAGLLGWEGVLLYLVNHIGGSNGGIIRITNAVISDLAYGTLTPLVGWIVMVVAVAIYALLALRRNLRRRASGLVVQPIALLIAKIAVIAVAGIVVVVVCNINRGAVGATLRGVPWVVPIIIAVLVLWTFLLGRTRFGKYIYAIGGNAEAARRAGINLPRIRLGAFILGTLTAGIAGIIYASTLGSMSANVDGGQLVLYAVAAAVIGGTSLFGGHGKMVHALVGGIIVAVINNGMGLIGLSAPVQLIVTALVLLAAVIVDAVARRGRTAG
jgi:D-xylose transport system permease protein